MKSTTKYQAAILKFICFTIILFSAGIHCKAAVWADTGDSLTLIKFQRELKALGWPAIWDTTKNVNQWYHIILEPVSGKVKSLIIKGDDFGSFTTDTLPSCIQTLHSLDSLEELYLINLGLSTLAPEIGGFKNLRCLGLQQNNLLSVPGEVAQLALLESLFLSTNKITDLPDLSGLKNLIYLSLSSNRNLLNIPETVFTLSKLQRLDIGYTSVTCIPEDIGNLAELEKLYADAAHLDSISPAIGNLSNLTELWLANNNLTTLPETLGKLTKLIDLDVSRNKLSELPASLSQLVSLLGIGFTDNQLESFPGQLVNLPQLYSIRGDNNLMKGSLPAGLFTRKGLRLYLEGNELSGKIEIENNNIPARLYIKNNRFTIKDIIEHYNLFIPANNTYIEFQPQKKIGTERTLYPENGSEFTVEIDNYIPAEGCTFTWLMSPYSNQDDSKLVSSNQVLEFQDFDVLKDGGNYYCVVEHPDVPDLSLKCNTIRVIGTDKAPQAELRNTLFRLDTIATVTVWATDDYTPVDSLTYNFPEETEHFLIEPYLTPSNRKIIPKNDIWTGTDTLFVSVTDENGNVSDAYATITVLPEENTPPSINIPDIYMSFYQDYVPACEPGAAGCNDSYIWESWTFLKYFIKDDLTRFDNLQFSLPEVDASGQYIGSDKVYAYLNETGEGIHLDVYVFADFDTTFTLTIQASDNEGGVSQQTVRFIAKASVPNQNPIAGPVPEQIIYKGTTRFPDINLNSYVLDDYLPDSLLTWRGDGSRLLDIIINDSVAMVSPRYADSVFTTTYRYYVYEKTNEWKTSSVEVTYKVLDYPKITGTISDAEGMLLENVKLVGFHETVFTDSEGKYEGKVQPGWSGKIYPEMESYTFSPDTVWYYDVLSDITGQNYTANSLLPQIYTVGFTLSDGVSPVEDARVDFNQSEYWSDAAGVVTITGIENGNYNYSIYKTGFVEINDMVTIAGSDTTIQIVLSRLTDIGEAQTTNGIVAYPNPFKNVFTLQISDIHEASVIQVCTLNGRIIRQIENNTDGLIRFDLSGYNTGIYVIRLFDNNKIQTLKIVKE